jgi:hypothetical protein
MDRQEVVSSVIGAVGYTHVLEIKFASGRVYQYYNVPEKIFQEMLSAESKGKYFNTHIRSKFPYQEIEVKSHDDHKSAAIDG